MKIYNYHFETHEYVGEGVADESPLEPGVFHVPAFATELPPLMPQEGKTVNFRNGAWVYEDIPEPAPEPEPTPLTWQELRMSEYPFIGDQLDALFHAGVFPPEMAARIQAVKDKYPKE